MYMSIKYWGIALFVCFSYMAVAQSFSGRPDSVISISHPDMKAYDMLHLPELHDIKAKRTIVVAIVDDGFSMTHRDVRNYFSKNSKEIPGNGIDDDHNGYVDDVLGWDVSDGDKDVSIPKGREEDFYHGTMVMSIVIRIAERCFGPHAYDYIRILPVKVLADKYTKASMDDGYDGIAYAVHQGADIIICAWSGGKYDKQKYQSIFDEADKKGITIIGSGGNFYSEQTDPPASISTVYAVGAIDSALHKIKSSNYGAKIDLVAAGDNVYAAHPLRDNTYFYGSGTSSAVSLIGGCATVLKVLAPEAQPREIFSALKNTAVCIDSLNLYYAGRLGAGIPDMSAAADYLLHPKVRHSYFNGHRPVGEILLDKNARQSTWEISPAGGFRGIKFTLGGRAHSDKDHIEFSTRDSLVARYRINDFPLSVFVPGGYARVVYTGKHADGLMLHYAGEPVDSPKLYCSGTKSLEGSSGEITDGSGSADYANNCDCKWQITVPEGKHIRLEFDTFSTQARVDYVYVFQGTGTQQENLIAKLSGPNLPPVVVSASNKVLIWFATDPTITGKGWHMRYTATDDAPGKYPPVGQK